MNKLLSTVSYPVMNLSLNISSESKNRKTEEYNKFRKELLKQRTLDIIKGRPYQSAFS